MTPDNNQVEADRYREWIQEILAIAKLHGHFRRIAELGALHETEMFNTFRAGAGASVAYLTLLAKT